MAKEVQAFRLALIQDQPANDRRFLSMRKTGLSSPAYADWFDCVVYDDARPIGRIYEDRHALPELRWFWSLTVLGAGHAGIPHNGREPTWSGPKRRFKRASRNGWCGRAAGNLGNDRGKRRGSDERSGEVS
jgi:hypothetical protein